MEQTIWDQMKQDKEASGAASIPNGPGASLSVPSAGAQEAEDLLAGMDFDQVLTWFESVPSLNSMGSLASPMPSISKGGFSFTLQNLPEPPSDLDSIRQPASGLNPPLKQDSGLAGPQMSMPSFNFSEFLPPSADLASSSSCQPSWQTQNTQMTTWDLSLQQPINVAIPGNPGKDLSFGQHHKDPIQLKQTLQQPSTAAIQHGFASASTALGKFYQNDMGFLKSAPVTTGTNLAPELHHITNTTPEKVDGDLFKAGLGSQSSVGFQSLAATQPLDVSKTPLDQLQKHLEHELKDTIQGHDVLLETLNQFSLGKLHSYPGSHLSLYSQMLKSKAQRGGPQQKSRTSAKEKMQDLERQVAELQQQKMHLLEATNNLECRLNIVDRMVQLRREGHAEATAQAVRIDEQLEDARKAGNLRLYRDGLAGGMLPSNRSLSKIFSPNYVDQTFLEMMSEWQGMIQRITRCLQAIERCPTGLDVASLPVAEELRVEISNVNVWVTQQQTRGGINLLQEFYLWLYNQECMKKGKDAVEQEFHEKYKQMYPKLALTLQQKERIKLSNEVYDKRTVDQSAARETYCQALVERKNCDQLSSSWVEACRDIMEADGAVHALRSYDTTMRDNRLMFSMILYRKVLNMTQQARLMVTSFPMMACLKTLARLVSNDLATNHGIRTTKVDDNLVNQLTEADAETKAYVSPSHSSGLSSA